MNIIWKYIANNIKDRKLRTAVMLLSIVLSTTLLLVSLSIGDSYAAAQRKMARGMAGSATVSVSMWDGGFVSGNILPHMPRVESAVGIVKAAALFKQDGYYENVDIIAADLDELAHINKPRLLDGATLGDFTGNQIVLPERFTGKFGVKPGDPFTLYIDGKPYEFTVAAIAAYDSVFLRHTRGTNALVPLETLAAITGADGGYSELLIKPAQGAATADVLSELKKLMPDKYTVSCVVNEAQVEADARQKSMPFFLISFFSLTMSVFIIYSSYKVITLERLPVVGTFRSIGATEKMVTRILMMESLVYGTLGALLGIPVGLVVLRLLLNGLGGSLSQGIDIPMIVSVSNVVLACGVAMLTSALSAWLPVRRASRLPVKEVVLGTVEEKVVSRTNISLMGLALFLISIILPRIGDNALFLMGGFSLVGLLMAAVIVIPLLTDGVSRLLEHVYGAIMGNVGWLAARNLRGNRNTQQNVTLLFISISAIIAISVVSSFVQVYVGDVFRGAKLDGFTDATMSAQRVQQIEQLDGIDEALPVRVLNNRVSLNGTKLSRVEGTDNLALYAEMFAMNPTQEVSDGFEQGRNILLSADCMKRTGIKTGDMVQLSYDGQEFEYHCWGGFKIRSTNTDAVIPENCAVQDFGAQNYGIVAYTAENPDSIMAQIRDLFGTESHWSRTVVEFTQDASSTVGAFLQPMRNLTWFILLLAAVGVMNNQLINHIQKRRSTAMYKSVGLSSAQNAKMTLAEAFATGLIGASFGMVVSWLEIDTIFMVAGPKISMQPELSLSAFLLAGILGVGIAVLGSIVPIMKTRNLRIVDELKFD